MRSRYCKVCEGFHNVEEDWPLACCRETKTIGGITIIKDIEPYAAVAVDKVTGKPPKIGSRREHREFLKRNGYVEVGNEPIRQRPIIDVPDSHRDVKRTLDQFRSEGRWK